MRTEILSAARVLQIVLLAGGLLMGLSWFEDRSGTERIGTEHLVVGYTATVEHAHGPWQPGDAITEHDAGIHLDAAPNATLTARMITHGTEPIDHTWSGHVEMYKLGPGKRPWWRHNQPIEISGHGPEATAKLHVEALVEQAMELDRGSNTAGKLHILVHVTHTGTLDVAGRTLETTRAATLSLEPDGRLVSLTPSGDQHAFTRAKPTPLPWIPAVMLAGALALELPSRWPHGARDPLSRAGIAPVEVTGLTPPRHAPTCTLETLIAAAEATGQAVVVDRGAGTVALAGELPLVASIEPALVGQGPAGEEELASAFSASVATNQAPPGPSRTLDGPLVALDPELTPPGRA